MSGRRPFNTLLKSMMDYVGLSPARLAKQLDLAPSTIHKWLTGERIPSKKSIEDIIDNITSVIVGSMKKNPSGFSLDRMAAALGIESAVPENGKENNTRKDTEYIKKDAEYIAKLLKDAYYYTRSSDIESGIQRPAVNNSRVPETFKVPGNTLSGYQAVVLEAQKFIQAAALIKAKSDTPFIIHLSNCHRFTFDLFSRLASDGNDCIEKIRNNGWTILNLLCMNRNEDAITPHIKDLLGILDTQNGVEFRYKYFDTGHYLLDDVLVVPGVGALLGFKVDGRMPDYAVVIREKEGMQNLYDFYMRIAYGYKPLDTMSASFPVSEQFSGFTDQSIYYINSHLGLAFMPEGQIANPTVSVKGFRDSLMRLPASGRFYHIIPKGEMMRYVKDGGVRYGSTTYKFNMKQRIAHIHFLREYLEINPKYHLIFPDDFENRKLPRINLLLIKDEKAVLETCINKVDSLDSPNPGFVLIREPLVLKAIHHYFQSVLGSTEETGSDRNQAKQWLESLLDFMEAQTL